jgi:hypothetical protein
MTFVRQILFLLMLVWLAWVMYISGRAVSRTGFALWIKVGLIVAAFAFVLAGIWAELGHFMATLNDATPLDMGPVFSMSFTKTRRAGFLFFVLVVPYLVGMLMETNAKRKRCIAD